MNYMTHYDSPLGKIIIASNEDSLIGLWFENQKYYMNTLTSEPEYNENIEILNQTKIWLDRYFHQENPSLNELKIAPIGNEFKQRVWKILCEIPYGETMTYGDIAKRIAKETNKKSMSAQAVGNAVGHNPISIIIPCHRVIGKDKSLTGYAGGIDKKIQLLTIEGIDTKQFLKPKI